jgi:hypothetical protein
MFTKIAIFRLVYKTFCWTALSMALSFVWSQTISESKYKPSTEIKDCTELHMVYIGSTGCGFCKVPELKQAVIQAKDLLYQRAQEQGFQFAATGVATDLSIDRGIEFLKDVGPFDQIIVGRSIFNLAIIDFVSKDAGARPGEPQIIVYTRELRRTPTRVLAGDPKLIFRIMGTAIVKWVSKGAPFDE